MAVTSYWGSSAADAREILPGESTRFTQYVVAYREYPLVAHAGGSYAAACAGAVTRVHVRGVAETAEPTSAMVYSRWTSDDPGVSFEDPTARETDALIEGIGSFQARYTCSVGAYEASDVATLTVTDDEVPTITSLIATPAVLWPPNHRMVEVNVAAAVMDGCDPAPVVRLVSATSSEVDRAPGRGAGATTGDIQDADLGMADTSLLLRAEREGRSRDRLYRLTYQVTDWAGNTSQRTVIVTVPHDRSRVR